MTKDEALKMAIEALEMHVPHYIKDRGCEAIQACKEALEQPSVAEPVAWIKALEIAYIQAHKQDKSLTAHGCRTNLGLKPEPDDVPLYTHPAPSWQGLSDDDIHNYADHNFAFASEHFDEIFKFARAIEQALKEKTV